METWALFKSESTFQKKISRGPSSRRQLPKDMSLLDAQLNIITKNVEQGTDYVAEYVEKEENEILEVNCLIN